MTGSNLHQSITMYPPGILSSITILLLAMSSSNAMAQDDPYPACYQFFSTWNQVYENVIILSTFTAIFGAIILTYFVAFLWITSSQLMPIVAQASTGIHSDIASAQSCQLLCVQEEDCVAFSWHFGSDQFDENTCQLFSGLLLKY